MSVAYLPRVVSWALAALIVASTILGASGWLIAATLAAGFGWPHVAYLLGSVARDQRAAGLRHLLFDGFLGGVFAALTGFDPLPAGSIAIVVVGFQLMMAGPRQFATGGAATLLGMALTSLVVGFDPDYVPSLLTVNLCLAFFAGAMWSSAYYVNRTTRELVATRHDLRDANRRMAGQARQLELAIAESIEVNEVARTVNAALDLDRVLEHVLQSLRKVFDFDQAGTLAIDQDRRTLVLDRFVGRGATGEIEQRLRRRAIPLDPGTSLFVNALGGDGPTCVPDIDDDTVAEMAPADREFWVLNPMRSIVVCPMEIRDEPIGLLCLGSRTTPCHLSETDLLTIERYVTHVATAVWSARLFEEAQRARRLAERELEIGREIQSEFLPERLPEMAGWSVAARLRSARQVSGDFYDAFELDSGRIAVVVADVCDKGVGAALFMALFRSLLRAAAGAGRDRNAPFAASALELANDYISRTHERSNMFATVFVAAVDPVSGEVEYANGGHEAPIVLRAAGGIERLGQTGPAVGLLPGSRFEVATARLAVGDTLVAFTDGVTEARAPSGELYSEERLMASLDDPDRTAHEFLDRIEADLERHVVGGPRSDDVTLLAVRRDGGAAEDRNEIEKGAA